MRAYVGQTRDRDLVRKLTAAGIGECVTRGDMPPRRVAWFYDNGAFEDWRAGSPFNGLQFSRDMRKIRDWAEIGIPRNGKIGARLVSPDFVVIPDVVGDGVASLAFSAEWYETAASSGAPLYLAVQNGMTPGQVRAFAQRYPLAGLFVGGTLDWKLAATPRIVALARELGVKVHVGRVGTYDRVLWARQLGVDSIDSSLPLWSEDKLETFLEALAAPLEPAA